MPRRDRRAKKPPTATSEAEVDLEAAGNASDIAIVHGRDHATPFGALELLGLDRAAAVFLVAYVRCRLTETEDAPNVLAIARQCRAHPWVWTALQRSDYAGLVQSLDICGLPAAAVPDLQRAVTEITAELLAAPAAPHEHASDTERAPELEELEPAEAQAP